MIKNLLLRAALSLLIFSTGVQAAGVTGLRSHNHSSVGTGGAALTPSTITASGAATLNGGVSTSTITASGAATLSGSVQTGRVVGIGTVPDADHDATLVAAAQEVGDWGLMQSKSDSGVEYARNAKIVAGQWVYRNTGEEAQLMSFYIDGTISFFTAPVGTAGAVILWTDKLTIPNASTDSIIIRNGLNIIGHPVAGYTRVGTGIYNNTSTVSYTSLPNGTLATIAAPAGAKGAILNYVIQAKSVGVTGQSISSEINVYSDAGTTLSSILHVAAYEFNAVAAGTLLNSNRGHAIVPVNGGNIYLKASYTGGSMAQYAIIGYLF